MLEGEINTFFSQNNARYINQCVTKKICFPVAKEIPLLSSNNLRVFFVYFLFILSFSRNTW